LAIFRVSLAAPASLGRLADCEGLHGRLPVFILLHDVSPTSKVRSC